MDVDDKRKKRRSKKRKKIFKIYLVGDSKNC
jgi:hypothetical protein